MTDEEADLWQFGYGQGYASCYDKFHPEVERQRALLKVARCPNTDCMLGVVPGNPTPDGDWDVYQCQWCDEKDAALDTEEGS